MRPPELKEIQEKILNILYQSDVRLTAQEYLKKINTQYPLPFSEAKKILQGLVDAEELSYHYLYGSTYVEKSFLKPVRISPHFILKPPWSTASPAGNHIEIIIEPGISFGSGQHPTTRLCLNAIDFCFFENQRTSLQPGDIGADIGTGSGVLAMAMCLAGLSSCTAYEIDPVSIREARRNIELNRLSGKIHLLEDTMKTGENSFSMACANLRYPTLVSLSETLSSSLKENGVAVLSGFREWEKDLVLNSYAEKGFALIWQRDDKNWSCFVLVKK
ncbi:MAG: 50S ribosomal protein L11 methyltransferase [Desulfobacteraceae bacterium]|nr:50S ribosomal protein L11 methyltransferase [Desulfobacteraceae bacterium]